MSRPVHEGDKASARDGAAGRFWLRFFASISRGWFSLGRWRPWAAVLVFVLAFAGLQFRHRDLPPYWDGTVNFVAAHTIAENGMSPFLTKADTGHPTLWAWALAAAMRLGVPPIAGFHLISWLSAGVLLGATWQMGRRMGGEVVGWVSAILVGLNPCVAGQALQYNLDLPMAAFGVLALALFAEGRFLAAGLSAAAMTLSKLNGAFGLAPFFAISLWLVVRDPRYRTPRALAGLASTCLFPILALGAWFLVKYLVLGRALDTGEYEQGRQTALAGSWEGYFNLLFHSFYQMLANNGMWYFLCALPLAAALRWATRADGDGQETPSARPLALSTRRILLLLALMALAQPLAQSVRSVATIPRYFMITYPSLVLPVVWAVWTSFPRGRRVWAVAVLAVVLGGVQVVKWHPDHWRSWHVAAQLLVSNPSTETGTNHEWSLGFVDILRQTRAIAEKLDRHIQPGQRVGGDWPFNVYLSDPRFGLVRTRHDTGDPVYPEWWHNRGRVDFLVIRDGQPFHQPLDYAYPGANGLTLIKSRTGAVGSLSLFQARPP